MYCCDEPAVSDDIEFDRVELVLVDTCMAAVLVLGTVGTLDIADRVALGRMTVDTLGDW